MAIVFFHNFKTSQSQNYFIIFKISLTYESFVNIEKLHYFRFIGEKEIWISVL